MAQKEVTKPVPIRSAPGIKRDGTAFDSEHYLDGLWCRWQRGKPRKILGYRAVTSALTEKVYGMHVYSQTAQQYAHLGSQSLLTQVTMDQFGNFTGLNNRTPGGFAASVDNLWQFDTFYDSVAGSLSIVGHAAPNLSVIDNTVETSIYYGGVTAGGALVASPMDPVSGGIVAVRPYLMAFGNDGRVDISDVNDLSVASLGSAFVAGSKIVAGLPLRGNGQGPSALLWALDSLVRATFDGSLSPLPFAFDQVAGQSSILSSQSVIEYDGTFYWIGVDRFLMFNGVVQEVPNEMNSNWFFDNINMAARQKVFVLKVPRFKEIWWCFPYGNATECTHAIIYNVQGRFWYDTVLPSTGRTAAYFPQVYARPFMCDLVPTTGLSSGYTLWQHETGVDSINGTDIQPIRSYFKTSEIAMIASDDPQNVSLRVTRLEPDYVQAGDLTMTVEGRDNARAQERVSDTHTITETAATPFEETVPLKDVRRLMSFRFESNVTGGDYQMGRTIGHIGPADGRVQS